MSTRQNRPAVSFPPSRIVYVSPTTPRCASVGSLFGRATASARSLLSAGIPAPVCLIAPVCSAISPSLSVFGSSVTYASRERVYAVSERRTDFTNRASSPFDGPRITAFTILRLTTRKASDATDIVLSSSLSCGLSDSSCRRLNIAKSASGTSRANFSGSVSSRVLSNISFQDTNLISLNESPQLLQRPYEPNNQTDN